MMANKIEEIIDMELKHFGSNNQIYRNLCIEIANAVRQETLKEVFKKYYDGHGNDTQFRRWLASQFKEAQIGEKK